MSNLALIAWAGASSSPLSFERAPLKVPLLYPVPPAALRLLWLHLRPLVIRHVVHAPARRLLRRRHRAAQPRLVRVRRGDRRVRRCGRYAEHDHPGAAGAAHRRRRGLERLSALARQAARHRHASVGVCVAGSGRLHHRRRHRVRHVGPGGRRPVGGTTCTSGQGHFASPRRRRMDVRSRSPARWPSTPPPTSPRGAPCSSTSRRAPGPRAPCGQGGRRRRRAPQRRRGHRPLPARRTNHLAHAALSGRPVLLIGAGSGVTPCLALLRMLASQPMPAGARVRFVVVARSLAVLETLDGFMLPSGLTASPASNGFLPSSTSPNAAAGIGGRHRRARRRRRTASAAPSGCGPP